MAICTGWVNSWTRNRNASSSPMVSEPGAPNQTPTPTTAATASPDTSVPVAKMLEAKTPARVAEDWCCSTPSSMRRWVRASAP